MYKILQIGLMYKMNYGKTWMMRNNDSVITWNDDDVNAEHYDVCESNNAEWKAIILLNDEHIVVDIVVDVVVIDVIIVVVAVVK